MALMIVIAAITLANVHCQRSIQTFSVALSMAFSAWSLIEVFDLRPQAGIRSHSIERRHVEFLYSLLAFELFLLDLHELDLVFHTLMLEAFSHGSGLEKVGDDLWRGRPTVNLFLG
jgi:hypothetical protein